MMTFEVYKGTNDELYFRLKDETGKSLLMSEGYKQKPSLMNGIESVKKNIPLDSGIEKKESTNGKYFFNVKSSNGQVVGTSTMFDTVELRDKCLAGLTKEVMESDIVEKI